MAVIKAPNVDYAGVSAGVAFFKGTGHTDDPYLIKWFRTHGYHVEETEEEKTSEPEESGTAEDTVLKEPEAVEDAEAEEPVMEEPVAPAQKRSKKKEG